MGVSGQLSRLGRFPSWEIAPGTHWIGGWVGPRAGLDAAEKRKILTLPGFEAHHYTDSLNKCSRILKCNILVR
jgi:hypothetical protein